MPSASFTASWVKRSCYADNCASMLGASSDQFQNNVSSVQVRLYYRHNYMRTCIYTIYTYECWSRNNIKSLPYEPKQWLQLGPGMKAHQAIHAWHNRVLQDAKENKDYGRSFWRLLQEMSFESLGLDMYLYIYMYLLYTYIKLRQGRQELFRLCRSLRT